jgi:2-octaprenyl-6-methoxyphenol hydroxylase
VKRSGGFPADCDVLVAGGGPVGATLALALRDSGRTVVLVEPQAKPSGPLRPVALSHGSRLVLERVGAFDRIAATPIEAIHVSQAGGFGRTLIDREDHDLPALGYVTDVSQVATVLLAAAERERVTGRVAAWRAEGERVNITVDCGDASRGIATRLLVLADGGQLAGDDLAMRDYGQTAIVATVRTELVHRGKAWERFTPEGPLALLPFGGTADAPHYIYALVWTVRAAEAPRLVALPDDRFLATLGERFGRRLGRFLEAGPRASYPPGSGSGARRWPGRAPWQWATPHRRSIRWPDRASISACATPRSSPTCWDAPIRRRSATTRSSPRTMRRGGSTATPRSA